MRPPAARPDEERAGGLAPRRLAVGLGGFAALAVLGARAAGWLERGSSRWLDVAAGLPAAPLAVALGLVAVDVALGGLRLHLWVQRLEPGVAYRTCVATYLVNMLAAAISPLGAASSPAQWGVLVRGGARPARAVAALLLNYVGILAALILLAGLALGYQLATGESGDTLGRLPRALFGGAAAAAAALLLGLMNPRLGDAAAAGVLAVGHRLGGRFGTLVARIGAALSRAVAEYRAARQAVRRGWLAPFATSLALSITMLLNKFAVGFLVARSLGFTGSYLAVASRQAVQFLMLYFSPSPGGSGLAEATVPAFMAGIVPQGRALAYAVLWRALTSYLGIAAGVLAAAVVFRPRPRRAATSATASDSPSSPSQSPAARTPASE